jgi:hypothetical protein
MVVSRSPGNYVIQSHIQTRHQLFCKVMSKLDTSYYYVTLYIQFEYL